MSAIALLHPGTSFTNSQILNIPSTDNQANDIIESLDVYDLPSTDLDSFCGLIVSSSADQEFLYRERDLIRRFLDGGKVLAFSGHLFRPWLPGASNFVPKTIHTFRDYTIKIVRPHPIFEGVDDRDLTFRRGVAGFFARGHHPPPAGAETLLTLAGDEPIVYVDRVSTRGTILVHSGNDLLGYNDADSTAGRIAGQLLRWIRDEAASLSRREVTA